MGNPVLSRIAKPVKDPKAPEIAQLVEDMKDTLADLGGSWLAAPQVFESLRLVVHRQNPQGARQLTDEANLWMVFFTLCEWRTFPGSSSTPSRDFSAGRCRGHEGMAGFARYGRCLARARWLNFSWILLLTEPCK